MVTAVITGGSSGLGAIIVEELRYHNNFDVINWSLESGVDITSEESVKLAALQVAKVDILINCAGVNYLEWIENVAISDWDKVINTNARGIFLTAKYLIGKARGGTILNIVSNASTIPMTTSIAYNASKAAALIMTKQMARELGKTHDITVFSISPNKLSGTRMSEEIEKRVCELRGWTKEQALSYQLSALPAREETDPAILAEFIGFLLKKKERHKYLQGCDIPYGGPN